jgi:hypothetical protein
LGIPDSIVLLLFALAYWFFPSVPPTSQVHVRRGDHRGRNNSGSAGRDGRRSRAVPFVDEPYHRRGGSNYYDPEKWADYRYD